MVQHTASELVGLACGRGVRRRALGYMAIVGTLLVTINHVDALMYGNVDALRVFKMMLTYCVPYCVSTVSAVQALLDAEDLAAASAAPACSSCAKPADPPAEEELEMGTRTAAPALSSPGPSSGSRLV